MDYHLIVNYAIIVSATIGMLALCVGRYLSGSVGGRESIPVRGKHVVASEAVKDLVAQRLAARAQAVRFWERYGAPPKQGATQAHDRLHQQIADTDKDTPLATILGYGGLTPAGAKQLLAKIDDPHFIPALDNLIAKCPAQEKAVAAINKLLAPYDAALEAHDAKHAQELGSKAEDWDRRWSHHIWGERNMAYTPEDMANLSQTSFGRQGVMIATWFTPIMEAFDKMAGITSYQAMGVVFMQAPSAKAAARIQEKTDRSPNKVASTVVDLARVTIVLPRLTYFPLLLEALIASDGKGYTIKSIQNSLGKSKFDSGYRDINCIIKLSTPYDVPFELLLITTETIVLKEETHIFYDILRATNPQKVTGENREKLAQAMHALHSQAYLAFLVRQGYLAAKEVEAISNQASTNS